MRGSPRRGSALIEVMVALVVLAVGGVALITLLGQTSRTMRATRDTERETRDASRVLDRFAAMNRATLAASVGRIEAGAFRANVVETAPGLFEVAIAQTDTSAVLLRGVFYRPDSGRDVAP